MPNAKPKVDHSERAARDLLNRKVREGVIDRRNANQIIKVGLPFVRSMLAEWRRDGCSPTWITGKFQSIRAEAVEKCEAASNPIVQRMTLTRVVAAEMYLAVWAGMQADLGQYNADLRSEREIDI
ncbi:hypothetical protein [Streptomyces malaysiensis]|uniref:Uncharacterized protein n=1 Tax=Streptomyces malaysiensis subsp. samsunensis TaxID=459658 RepID=A0A9X2LYH3_STRMQ|nr:hypothetical protein [Streptomyces samsunensis]MCQ8831818.1 hypothetical protein [Streptomyces samsunensis]